MIKLAVFDVDGTLVETGDGQPTKKTVDTLHKLRANGIKVAVASGRAPFFVKGYLDKFFPFDYYICSNGCFVMDHQFNEIHRESLSKEDVEGLIVDFDKKDDAIMFQFEDGAYVYNGQKRIHTMIDNWISERHSIYDARAQRNRHDTELPIGAVTKIRTTHIDFYREKYPHLAFDMFNVECYDIHKIEDSKMTGIQILMDTLSITKDNVIAFGDNFNDLQMLQNVGIGVAMGNGIDEVKAIASFVTKSVAEDGITFACQHYNLI